MTNQTYNTARRLIQAGRCEREHMLACLDIFLMAARISPEQYTELILMLPDAPDPETEPAGSEISTTA